MKNDTTFKAIGVVRRIDELGRVTIPVDVRREYEIEIGNPIEMYVEGDKIFFAKFIRRCIFCEAAENIHTFHKKAVCQQCINDLYEYLSENASGGVNSHRKKEFTSQIS